MLAATLGFAAVALVLTVTPGLDTMLVLRSTLGGGRRAGWAAGLGIGLGCYVWGVATAVGLTALLAASEVAYDVVRWAGAAYLLYLGARALWAARGAAPAATADAPAGTRAALRTGLVTNLLNPKVGIPYMTLLPQFVPADAPMLPATLLLVSVHVALGLAWTALLVFTAGAMRARLTRPAVKRRLEQTAGAVFILIGLRVAAEAR
ncbi:LysE family translocator [Bailinhaonella thermotolerans]|uniref:LysE family translocator n=1 Tax=Bailinhaonella thermotolerans TaxID=1070861 RepID=A0A3A4A733_9ACTN|nr:LysE family translocator [Bailinhaonella thermotolerans]RJL24756.1 LysE family translocator [Bailinhaonella thermotolerans]